VAISPSSPAGDNFRARCPFHNEKTPSFMVSKSKQIFHCFGCAKGGDLISFVQEYEGLSFSEAIKLLAAKANITLSDKYTQAEKKDYSQLNLINQTAAEFYKQKLFAEDPSAKKVLAYLQGRSLSTETIKDWHLGLSGDTWDELFLFLQSKGFSENDIFQAGLSLKKKSGSGFVDRFRKRLMFPIWDNMGQVVAFTSRTLSGIVYEEAEMGGKYVNSPQTALYDKSKILYGWHKAKEEIRRKKYLIVVEGNMDVIATHQAGTKNVVAVSGTALTLEHIQLIKRYTENIILAFDGDNAGSNAALRSIVLGWQNELNQKVLILKDAKDPADLVRDNPKAWVNAISQSMPVMDYYFQRVLAGVDLNRSDHKKIAVNKLLPLIKFLKSNIEQSHYLQLLADKLNLPLDILQLDFKNSSTQSLAGSTEKPTILKTPDKNNHLLNLSCQLLSLALFKDIYLQKVFNEFEPEMFEESLQGLYKKLIIYYTKQQSLSSFLDQADLEQIEKNLWISLSMQAEKDYAEMTVKELDQHFQDTFNFFKKQYLSQKLQSLIHDLKQAEINFDEIKQDQIAHEINLLNKEIYKLQ
jgi:DNA primase